MNYQAKQPKEKIQQWESAKFMFLHGKLFKVDPMSEEEHLDSCLDIRFASLSVGPLDNQEKSLLFLPKVRKVLGNQNVR